MRKVDFDYLGEHGYTIYNACFQKHLRLKSNDSKLVLQTEAVFDFLVEHGIKNGYNVDSILEIPSAIGDTCFQLASQYSKKISNYIIERDIKLNSVSLSMICPSMIYPDLTIKMMEKGINPRIISNGGKNQIDHYTSNFVSEEAKSLLATFTRSIHYSIEDIDCEEFCPTDCPSNFKRFYSKAGSLVEMIDQNRIGRGGFGMVFRQSFHGTPMAMKCIPTNLEDGNNVNEVVSDLEANISELRIQSATAGSGVIVPVAFVRQQDQEQDENGKWIAYNYNIYIYPLCDCNLHELHQNHHDRLTEQILSDILNQCLIRIGSN